MCVIYIYTKILTKAVLIPHNIPKLLKNYKFGSLLNCLVTKGSKLVNKGNQNVVTKGNRLVNQALLEKQFLYGELVLQKENVTNC